MSRERVFLLALILAAALGTVGLAIAQQPVQSDSARKAAPTNPRSTGQLPNGATSINETYGDWTIGCRLADREKRCLLSQAQGNNQTKQRVFEIELRAPRDGKTEGTVLMPLGLKLEPGAILKLDDKEFGEGLNFSACLPEGCLLPVSFSVSAVDTIKKAKVLTVASLGFNGSDVVTFKISLEGFAAAVARIAELSK